MTAGFMGIFLWVRIVRPLMRRRRPWTVASVQEEDGDITSITLQPVGHEGFTFAPGQFGWLGLHRSPFALTQHPFSFSSDGDDSTQVQMSIKGLGDFTKTICSVTPGTRRLPRRTAPRGLTRPVQRPGIRLPRRRCRHRSDHEHAADVRVTRRAPALLPVLRGEGARRYHVPRGDRPSRHDPAAESRLPPFPSTREVDGRSGYIDIDLLRDTLPANYGEFQYFICGPGAMQGTPWKTGWARSACRPVTSTPSASTSSSGRIDHEASVHAMGRPGGQCLRSVHLSRLRPRPALSLCPVGDALAASEGSGCSNDRGCPADQL